MTLDGIIGRMTVDEVMRIDICNHTLRGTLREDSESILEARQRRNDIV